MCECVCVRVHVCVLDSKALFKIVVAFLSHAQPKSDLTPQFLQLVQEFLNLLQYQSPITKISRKIAISLV